MLPPTIENSILATIKYDLSLIEAACAATINNIETTTPQQQQESYEQIQNPKIAFIRSLYQYQTQGLITTEEESFFTQALIDTTYDLDKIASRQNFGITQQPIDLPTDTVKLSSLQVIGGATVASANQTAVARLPKGKKVFFKNTKPDVAQLEIVAAEFYRQMLGNSRTSHGKIVIEGREIRGMYVEGIPGFISMRQLTDLATDPDAYIKIQEKIDELAAKIEKLEKIPSPTPIEQAELNEAQNSLGTYTQVRDLHLIDTTNKRVDLAPLAKYIAKTLCSAHFFEDWDRHKENFGISFDTSGGLGVASLDYDKSLTGTFQQDNKSFDWNITPTRLRDFPEFDCWYWPTQSHTLRGWLASIFTPKKTPKMYSEEEARQYAELAHNEEFQQQCNIEWLKLIFIPQKVRQFAVDKLACGSNTTLRNTPNTLETKRQTLLNTAIQLNRFRKIFDGSDNALKEETLSMVKTELQASLSSEEFDMVDANWNATLQSIEAGVAKVVEYENIAKGLGYSQLLKAIERTGISFSPTPPLSQQEFQKKLEHALSLTSSMSSKTLSKILNKEFGLSITEADARTIKQELYIKMISRFALNIANYLTTQNFDIKAKFGTTFNAIKELEKALQPPQSSDPQNAIKCLRNLGVKIKDFSDNDLKRLIGLDCHPPVPRQSWQDHGGIAPIIEPIIETPPTTHRPT